MALAQKVYVDVYTSDLDPRDAAYSSVANPHDAAYSLVVNPHDTSYSSVVNPHDAAYSSVVNPHDAAYSSVVNLHDAAYSLSAIPHISIKLSLTNCRNMYYESYYYVMMNEIYASNTSDV